MEHSFLGMPSLTFLPCECDRSRFVGLICFWDNPETCWCGLQVWFRWGRDWLPGVLCCLSLSTSGGTNGDFPTSNLWQLPLNKLRIHSLHQTIFRRKYVYNNQIERVHQYKYLGAWISDDLAWSKHIESVCNRSRRLLGYIFRTFSPHCSRTPFSTYIQVSGVTHSGLCSWMGMVRRTNYFLRKSNCLLLELQQNPGLRNRLLSLPASTSHHWWSTAHIWNLIIFAFKIFGFCPFVLFTYTPNLM